MKRSEIPKKSKHLSSIKNIKGLEELFLLIEKGELSHNMQFMSMTELIKEEKRIAKMLSSSSILDDSICL